MKNKWKVFYNKISKWYHPTGIVSIQNESKLNWKSESS
ncbi:hypothetical protein DVDV_3804 [Desulfovibrio sp. DV]|nr:hypothetical protein DVDV_3804 [Desulfovibrio sp. DV]